MGEQKQEISQRIPNKVQRKKTKRSKETRNVPTMLPQTKKEELHDMPNMPRPKTKISAREQTQKLEQEMSQAFRSLNAHIKRLAVRIGYVEQQVELLRQIIIGDKLDRQRLKQEWKNMEASMGKANLNSQD
jgi:hypothetical protein